MVRMLPEEIVKAYSATGLIPIRMAWTTTDRRGGCALDALAKSRGCSVDTLRGLLDEHYEAGFLAAWDADDPNDPEIIEVLKSRATIVKRGYADGILCRRAVERAFDSGLVPVHDNVDSPVDEA
ncbi:MAG: hypothetical protein AB7L09_03410 [Nitrospira sp.]